MGQRKRSKQQATFLSAAGLVQPPIHRNATLRGIRTPWGGPWCLLRAGCILPGPWPWLPLPRFLQPLLLVVGPSGRPRGRPSPVPASADDDASTTAEPVPAVPIPDQVRASCPFVFFFLLLLFFFFFSPAAAPAAAATTAAAEPAAGSAEAGPAHCHLATQPVRSSRSHR